MPICVSRNEAFGCDDEDARIAYQSQEGRECLTTLDLARLGVERGLLSQDQARTEYEKLRSVYRFFGASVTIAASHAGGRERNGKMSHSV